MKYRRMNRKLSIISYFAIFWIVIPVILYLLSVIPDKYLFHSTRLTSGWIIPGVVLSITGFLILLLAIYQFVLFSGEFPVSATPPDKVIQRGLFAVWRHPIYLFASTTFLGIAMISRSPSLLFFVFPAFIVLVTLYTLREESVLIKRFGDGYAYYRKNVPLLVPRLHQWLRIPGSLFVKAWFRIKVINRENIPSSLPFIILSGHRHYFDPLFISYAIQLPVRHVSTYEIFRNPLLGKIFTICGVIPRKRFTKDILGTRQIISAVKAGFPVCLFPEGGRSWTGRLMPFKSETIKLLRHLRDIPILPVRIEGNYHSWPRWADHLIRSDVTVIIEKPIMIDPEMPDETLETFLRNSVEPKDEIEGNVIKRGKIRTKNLSRVIYRCPVCFTSESPVELPPEKLYCKLCQTTFLLGPDYKFEFNSNGTKKMSIHDLYNCIKIKLSDIYSILPEVLDDNLRTLLGTGEFPIYFSTCQLWKETKSIFKKTLKGIFLLTNQSIIISNLREHHVIPLTEIGAVTIESNYKLQIFNEQSGILDQITFEKDSALKVQDILKVILAERSNKQTITT